jgi:hypothetical protein
MRFSRFSHNNKYLKRVDVFICLKILSNKGSPLSVSAFDILLFSPFHQPMRDWSLVLISETVLVKLISTISQFILFCANRYSPILKLNKAFEYYILPAVLTGKAPLSSHVWSNTSFVILRFQQYSLAFSFGLCYRRQPQVKVSCWSVKTQ